MDIYVPEAAEEPLPVLYLLHGINGYEGSWQDKGGAIDTLRNMIADGRCKPVILVMPDCNKWPFKERPVSHGNLWKCLMHYGRLSREHELEQSISDLMDMIDTTYCVSSCAVAGLSDGGRIAANVANLRPDRVRQVGLFSPVLHKDQLPNDSTRIYSIYVGKEDIFAPSCRISWRIKTKACDLRQDDDGFFQGCDEGIDIRFVVIQAERHSHRSRYA